MMNKFNGSIMSLDKLDVINILDIITNLKPSLPELVDNSSISKLWDIGSNTIALNYEQYNFFQSKDRPCETPQNRPRL